MTQADPAPQANQVQGSPTTKIKKSRETSHDLQLKQP